MRLWDPQTLRWSMTEDELRAELDKSHRIGEQAAARKIIGIIERSGWPDDTSMMTEEIRREYLDDENNGRSVKT